MTNRHENITSGVGVSTDDYDAVYPFDERFNKADLRKEKAVLLTKEAGMAVSTKPTGAKLCDILLHICSEYNVTLNRYIDMVQHRYIEYDIVLRYINCI